DARPWPLPVATEQIERTPAECDGTIGPTTINEPAAIVDEACPPSRRHVPRGRRGIEPGKGLGPGARRAAVVLDDGPADRMAPPSPIRVSYPAEKRRIISCAPAICAASITVLASGSGAMRAMFSVTVPSNSSTVVPPRRAASHGCLVSSVQDAT